MNWNVLIPDAVDPVCDEILRAGGCRVTRLDRPGEEELLEIVDQYDAMVVRSAVKVTAPMISRMSRMKVIGRAGAGVDNIDDLGVAVYAVDLVPTVRRVPKARWMSLPSSAGRTCWVWQAAQPWAR